MESIIGKKYIPCDNSYSVNITSTSGHPYKNERLLLAACIANDEKINICTIISEPFLCNVKSFDGSIISEKMIAVEYENTTSLVLFYESQIQ